MNLSYKMLFVLAFLNTGHSVSYTNRKSEHVLFDIKRDSIIKSKTVIIDGTRYTAINTVDDHLGRHSFNIKNPKGQIVYTANEGAGIMDFKFVDFNGDGFKDILLDLDVADSGVQDLILYNPKSKKFVLAGNCSNANKIKNTKYFYSYQDCCAGRNWDSGLFYISNSKIIEIGHITYNDGDGLWFYKLIDRKKILIRKRLVRINGDTPITTGTHIDFDLGYYWTKHWREYME
jgi:hypothetical protein